MTAEPEAFVLPTPFTRLYDEEHPNWRQEYAEREAANLAKATTRLAEVLLAAGGDPSAVGTLMPTLVATLRPRIDTGHGELMGTMLMHTFGDPGRTRTYEALRLSTPWQEVPR